AFLNYTVGEEGQKVLADAGYAPLPAEIAAKVPIARHPVPRRGAGRAVHNGVFSAGCGAERRRGHEAALWARLRKPRWT
ncbi:hypothetical protein ABZ070_37305, partial [Streptomyces sp. NPDC006283]|uniref:hypothetical protein n=1 Tax=Streptomyces sp. NPDC006283 TaxID=3156741 RepID=UPI0033AD7116